MLAPDGGYGAGSASPLDNEGRGLKQVVIGKAGSGLMASPLDNEGRGLKQDGQLVIVSTNEHRPSTTRGVD